MDVVDTALREAREELGVSVATEKVWGILKPLRDMVGVSAVLCLHQIIHLKCDDVIIAVYECMAVTKTIVVGCH